MDERIENTGDKNLLRIGDVEVHVSNPGKIYFPGRKISKGDVIVYYQSMAKFILPHLKTRPMSLKRNPNGIHGEAFFQKNAGDKVPSWIKTFETFADSPGRMIDYFVCDDEATLVYLANLGCIEMNPWNSVCKKPGKPTWAVIDIDPSDTNNFEQVIETALAVKEICDRISVTAFCKTSGSTGMHVYIPLGEKYDYDIARNFAEMVAKAVHELVPSFTSLERSLKKRGDKIYIDYLQNSRGQTLAAVYSLRPVVAATVSAPLEWEEVKRGLHPSQFDMYNICERVQKKGDLFASVLTEMNDIKKAIKALHV